MYYPIIYISYSWTNCAIELLVKDGNRGPGPHDIDFFGSMGYEQFTIPSYSSFTWFTFKLATPKPVNAGVQTFLSFCNVWQTTFATNSSYLNGSSHEASASTPNVQGDLLFRIHSQPIPGSCGWQNMN